MVMWSEFNRSAVRDRAGKHARLLDATLDLVAGDYPKVRTLVLGRDYRQLPFDSVQRVDWGARAIHIDDLDAARAMSESERN